MVKQLRKGERNSKGSVRVDLDRGRLRLQLPRHLYSKRVYLYLGLEDSKKNREKAEATAKLIESDIFFKQFDFTLEKYKESRLASPSPEPDKSPSLTELWQTYTVFKAKTLSPSSLKDFRRVANHIAQMPAQSLSESRTIVKFLTEKLTPDTARRVLMQLNACCQWAVSEQLIKESPFTGKAARIKVRKNSSINPFTAAERDLIISTFEASPQHQHYAPFVRFLFSTGCRTSEAVGLLWQHIDPGFSSITFCEGVVEGRRTTTTKTHKTRKFPINSTLKKFLEAICPTLCNPTQPVFTDQQGNLVRPNNFLRRHWQPVVKSLPLLYRPQYNTRHTFITLCLEEKVPISQVAYWVGNSPRIILSHYAGLTRFEVPEL